MNYKKLFIGITISNLFAWAMVELWLNRYANTEASTGVIFLIILQLGMYYISFIISSGVIKEEEVIVKITPLNCPGHDWQPHQYSTRSEQCIICNAERGKA